MSDPRTPAAIPAYHPVVQRCATTLYVHDRRLKSCGQSRGDLGRIGTYDGVTGRYTWGAWRALWKNDSGKPVPALQPWSPVTATDGWTGAFYGYPDLASSSGRITYGTQYQTRVGADGRKYYVGRRGELKWASGLFHPYGAGRWYGTDACMPHEPCPEWHHEPGKPRR